jgi:hypothetical protein
MNEKIKTGFYYGLGLSVPLLVSLYAFHKSPDITTIINKFNPTPIAEPIEFAEGYNCTKVVEKIDPKFELGEHTVKKMGKIVLITGEIKNTGTETLKHPAIEADLFNEKGEFVFKCNADSLNNVLADKQEYYMITCGCCGSEGVPDFKDAKLNVTFSEY